MPERKAHFILTALLALWATASPLHAELRAPDEKAIWTIWKAHTENVTNHVQIAEACRAFIAQKPADPYVVVARGLLSWHLLKLEQTGAAVQILTLLSRSPYTSEARMEAIRGTHSEKLHEIGMEFARRWLTRIDREQIREALGGYYQEKGQYPRTLEELEGFAEGKKLRSKDRWDKSWSYRVSGYETIKGTYGQQYHLVSTTLGDESSLAEALDIPYASRITLKAVRALSTGGQLETVEFKSPEEQGSIFLRVGTKIGNTYFAHEGERILVLSDGDHWAITPKPRA